MIMLGMEIAIALIIILVLIIIYIGLTIQANTTKFYEEFISGYWVGDQEFLDKSGLSELNMLIMHKKDQDLNKFEGYVVMADDNSNIILSSGFDLHLEKPAQLGKSDFIVSSITKTKGHFIFDEQVPSIDDLNEFDIALSVVDGSLTISSGEKVYAYMAKDNMASRTSKLAYAEEESYY